MSASRVAHTANRLETRDSRQGAGFESRTHYSWSFPSLEKLLDGDADFLGNSEPALLAGFVAFSFIP